MLRDFQMLKAESGLRVQGLLLLVMMALLSAQALAEGRVYLMTNSVSKNVTSLHIINSSSSAQSFTGTLYNGDGEQLGGADVSLHTGTIASQGRLILSAAQLESLFSTSAWSGPAMLVVKGPNEFDLMTKLTSPSGLVSNTNCVRTDKVHNVEGFDSSNNTFVRFINTGTTALSDIKGTLKSSTGSAIGSQDVTLVSSLAPNAAVWLNRQQLSDLVGAQWDGTASLEMSASNSDLKLLNLNFVNQETFFNFSCFESSDSADVYLMTNSASRNVSETHIINTSSSAHTFQGTIHDGNGNQLGASSSTLHTGSVAPGGRVIIGASDLESATGASAWAGPAVISIEGSGSFELMTRLTSPSGLSSNTNCVRQKNVQNVEGPSSSNRTFVRFINTGSSPITNVKGTLYDTSGNVIGTANSQLLDSIPGEGATWLNRDQIRDKVGQSWDNEANLVVTADDDSNLRLLNLNFVNEETFFNFSCYEKGTAGAAEPSTTDAKSFFEANVSPTVQSRCVICHVDGGVAGLTPLIYARSSDPEHIDLNYALLDAYIKEDASRKETMLEKVRGVNHGGGPQLSSTSEEYGNLSTFLDLLTGSGSSGSSDEEPVSMGGYWEGVTMMSAEQTLRRASMVMLGQPPLASEVTKVLNGGEAALRTALRDLMQGDEFHEFILRGANDRLFTDSLMQGFFDAADLNFPYFVLGATKQYEQNLAYDGQENVPWEETRWRQEWNWGLARAPLELIAYVIENDRNYQEVVTADYMMMNRETNEILRGGLSFSSTDDHRVYKPAENKGQIVQDDRYQSEFFQDFGLKIDSYGSFIDYPHAGVLNTQAFLSRYPTTETNRNRARARWTYLHFLGVDIEKSAARTTDPEALADTNNPTMNNPACTVCHTLHDPVAGTFQNYGNEGIYRSSWGGMDALPETYKHPEWFDEDADPSEYQEGDTWFRDMRLPGIDGKSAPSNTNSIQWLGEEIANDPRFATASVRFWWPVLMGGAALEAPEVSSDVGFQAKLAAFEQQNADIETMGSGFSTGFSGGAAFNGKDLLVEMMMSPWFRAESVENAAVADNLVEELGTRRLLTPEELEKKSESLLGWKWGEDDYDDTWDYDNNYTGLGNNYRIYYGGIDSDGITQRSSALTALMTNVAEKHALEMACPAVVIDFRRNDGERLLFDGIDLSVTPATESQTTATVQGTDISGRRDYTHTAQLGAGSKTALVKYPNPFWTEETGGSHLVVYNIAITNNDTGEKTVVSGGSFEESQCGNKHWTEINNGQPDAYWLWGTCDALTVPIELSEPATITVTVTAYGESPGPDKPNLDISFNDTDVAGGQSAGAQQIRAKLADLHNTMLGEEVDADDPEVLETYKFLVETWQERARWVDASGRGNWAFHWPEEQCNWYRQEHWEDENGPAHDGQDPTYMKNTWTTVLIYLMTDFNYIHE